jgi:hypothetical protein
MEKRRKQKTNQFKNSSSIHSYRNETDCSNTDDETKWDEKLTEDAKTEKNRNISTSHRRCQNSSYSERNVQPKAAAVI